LVGIHRIVLRHQSPDAGVEMRSKMSISRRSLKLTSISHRRRSPLMTTAPRIFL